MLSTKWYLSKCDGRTTRKPNVPSVNDRAGHKNKYTRQAMPIGQQSFIIE